MARDRRPRQYSFVFSNIKDRVNPKQVTLDSLFKLNSSDPGYESKEEDKKYEKEDREMGWLIYAAGVELKNKNKIDEIR